MINATLRLFNAVRVESKKTQEIPQVIMARTIKNSYIIEPSIPFDNELLNTIESHVGISGEKANAAFHKSWSIVKNSSTEDLIVQQILHYFTTYGYEKLGTYREDTVYIPHETLNLPEIREDIPLIIIKALNSKEILEKIINLGSGIALSTETLNDIMTIIETGQYKSDFVDKIANQELKARLYDYYNLVPTEPVEFLRFLISKLTNESLLIKNKALIEKIKSSNGKFLDFLIMDAPDNLASIFYRYKPLFLAMKSISRNKKFFNQLRKKAKTMHIPLQQDYLNSITEQIQKETLDTNRLKEKLKSAGIFRKIRLAYALNHRIHTTGSIVYKIRNGRGWATKFNWPAHLQKQTQIVLDTVILSIAEDIRKNVEGKTFYIPANVHYTLPATEKQFTGNFPSGSYISVTDNLILGIHWMNTTNKRVDLDLSVIGESGKIGWDAQYRTGDRRVLFSGDITDAPPPNGATELFYFEKGVSESRILIVNYFNFSSGDEVDCKILLAQQWAPTFHQNYMVDINNIIAEANINISKKQTILGLVANKDGENRVYFSNISIGNSITSSKKKYTNHTRKYLMEYTMNTINFKEILQMAGAIVIDKISEEEHINLSPQALTKETFINLFL